MTISGNLEKKIGIFGGCFNPVHNGHQEIARSALLSLSEVIWVPIAIPSYRQAIAYHHRLNMVKLVIADEPRWRSLQLENTKTASYGINIWKNLNELYPNVQWYWIMGLDSFKTLPKWYQRADLIRNVTFLIAPRGNNNIELECQAITQQLESELLLVKWSILDCQLIDISSTIIRKSSSMTGLIDPQVENYIIEHGLYQYG